VAAFERGLRPRYRSGGAAVEGDRRGVSAGEPEGA